jgi:DNA-binding MarR family transcriptional regulator
MAVKRESGPRRGHFVQLAESAGPSEPLALMHFAFRAVVKGPDEILARRGLGRVHHRILFLIARFPGCTVGELYATLGITKQALHGPLQALQRAKLVVGRPEPTNRRLRRLTLTAAGAALEDRLSGAQRAMFAAVFRQAGPAAAAAWREVMRALTNRL